MRLVFCGTPEFAVPSLEAVVAAGHEILLVLTQPDRPAGRGMEVQISAVKRAAQELELEIAQPSKIRNNIELQQKLEVLQPEAIVVVAYGRIIPAWMLALPKFGNINVHGSLLPKYRGAAPVQWAVANGEHETGVTTMRLDEGLDTGETLLFHRISVGEDTTAAELLPQLSHAGAGLLIKTLAGLEAGTLEGKPQNHGQATLAPILTREDGRLDLGRTAQQSYDRWRGFAPWPGCWTEFRGKRFLLHKLRRAEAAAGSNAPGSLWVEDGKLLLGCAAGTAVELVEVQMEGKARLASAAFAKDFQLKPGERVG